MPIETSHDEEEKADWKRKMDRISAEVSRMRDARGVVPGLAVILVGNNRDSAIYVGNKKEDCKDVGINYFEVRLAEDSTNHDVLNFIRKFNYDSSVHGIVVPLPLPSVCFFLF